jgi:hypothetical protein
MNSQLFQLLSLHYMLKSNSAYISFPNTRATFTAFFILSLKQTYFNATIFYELSPCNFLFPCSSSVFYINILRRISFSDKVCGIISLRLIRPE